MARRRVKQPRPYKCCKHCRKECPDATTGHIQTCPDVCAVGSETFVPKEVSNG